jgi:hypothetical protein
MLIPVFADGWLLADPLAPVLEQANMFPRAVTHATEIIQQHSQHSINEYSQTAL